MKRLILIITLSFVVCYVYAGLLNPDHYIVYGKIVKDSRWGGHEGQEITLEFFRIAGLIVELECKELGFRYEFKDSQGGFLKGRYLEKDQPVTTKDGQQVNCKYCQVELGNFGFQLLGELQSYSDHPALAFIPNATDKEQKLTINILLITHKYGETLEKQLPHTFTFEENWLYQMFKAYDKVENDIHDGEPRLVKRPS